MSSDFIFNHKKAPIFKLAKIAGNPIVRFSSVMEKFFFWASVITFLLFFINPDMDLIFLGYSVLFFSLFLGLWQFILFINSKAEKIDAGIRLENTLKNPAEVNLAELFDFRSAKAIQKIIGKKKREIDSNALALVFFIENPEFNFIFTRAEIPFNEIKKILKNAILPDSSKKNFSYSDDFKETVIKSVKSAIKRKKKKITSEDILIALSETNPFLKSVFHEKDLEKEDVENLAYWLESIKKKIKGGGKPWEWKNLIKKGSLAGDWTFGYTILLDKFSIDWTAKLRKSGFPEMIGHEKEMKDMERILSRREMNNVLLVGETGTGRKTMIYEIARKSFCEESLPEINRKKIVELDVSFLLAQVNSSEEVESLLNSIFQEVISAGNIILVISNFDSFIGADYGVGKLDISGALSSYLHFPEFQIIAITDRAGFRKNIEKNPLIAPFFEKIEVPEISEKEVLILLQEISPILERKYGKIISYLALKSIISYSAKYLPSLPFPRKAMDLLDEAMVHLTQTGEKFLLAKHIAQAVSQKANVPVGEMDEKEKEVLLNLEDLIHQRVINQEEAVREISSALRRSRTEISERKKPMGSFLFLGPTGVGKTETAKALTASYFGSEDRIIRMDMSEFQNLTDIARLIGSHESDGFLTTKIRENPFSLILLDELEKAHPDILNIFLQILDEGHVTDGFGRKISFSNSIIIATSNAGAQFIMEKIAGKMEWGEVKENLLTQIFEKNIFRPEFVNRFDAVVLFKPLGKENLLAIADLILSGIKEGMKKKGIEFVYSEELKESLVAIGYNPNFGARELRRVIQDKVENSLASSILSGKIKKGDKIKINHTSFEAEIIY